MRDMSKPLNLPKLNGNMARTVILSNTSFDVLIIDLNYKKDTLSNKEPSPLHSSVNVYLFYISFK